MPNLQLSESDIDDIIVMLGQWGTHYNVGPVAQFALFANLDERINSKQRFDKVVSKVTARLKARLDAAKELGKGKLRFQRHPSW